MVLHEMLYKKYKIQKIKKEGVRMFCTNCGQRLDDDARFCPECGQEVEVEKGVETNHAAENEKKDWKEYLTKENIERYAPIAALMPLVMALSVKVFGGLLVMLLSLLGGFGIAVASVVIFLLKAIFCLVSLAACGGLIYLAIKEKDASKVWAWVAPVATVFAFISCICIAFSWSAVAWVFGIPAVVIGLEMFSRITMAGKAMDTPMDPKGAMDTYGKYYKDYKAKYPTTKDLERAGIMDPENSYFDGNGIELLGYMLLTSIVSGLTCGIATPWMLCMVYKWRISHTVINGKRLTFTGTGASLLGHWLLWELLTIVTCGIFAYFSYVSLCKWEASHTFIDGEPMYANGSYFDGTALEYFAYSLLSGLMLVFTCGIAYPWVMAMMQDWEMRHQVVNNRRLSFSGTGIGFLGEYLIIAIFTVITCGIYSPWGTVRMNKYVIRHTDFVNLEPEIPALPEM